MLPTVQLGPWQIGTFSIFAIAGLLVTGLYCIQRLARLDQPPRVILSGFVLTILAAMLAGLAMSFLITSYRAARYGLLARPEGLSIVFGFAAGALVAGLYSRMHDAPVGRVLDLIALPIPLGLAIARLGCAAAGCCYGRPTGSVLGLYLPDEQGVWAVRYPTQLMSSVVNLCIFAVLVAFERYGQRRAAAAQSWPFNGAIFLLALILYSAKRFVMGYLRDSGTPLLGPFTWMHLSALIVLFSCLALFAWNLRRAPAST